MRGCLCALFSPKTHARAAIRLPPTRAARRKGALRTGPRRERARQRAPRASEAQHLLQRTMADAASQKLANDLARAEARKTLWETELAGLAARREDDAAAAAAAVKESVLAREAADPLMTVHGDADANPYARPARGGGGCAVM